MNIQDVMIHLLLKQPFYGYIAASFAPVENKTVKTVRTKTSPTIQFMYNKEWFEALDLEKAIGVLLHELLHILLLHPYRKENREHNLWAIACDMAVNEHIAKELLPEDAVTVEKIAAELKQSMAPKRSAEHYYDVLPKDDSGLSLLEKNEEVIVRLKSGEELKSNKTIEEDSSELNRSSAKSALSELVEQARFEGDIPGSISNSINELYKPGQVNWRNVLKRFLSGKGKANTRKSCKKESKRFEDLPGIKRSIGVDALVAIDESSSMSDRQIEAFYMEMLAIKRITGANISVVQFDTECTKPIPLARYLRSRSRLKNGGTDFRPVFQLADEMRMPLLILFTDGEGTAPEAANQKVIWILTKEGRKPADFGHYIYIEQLE